MQRHLKNRAVINEANYDLYFFQAAKLVIDHTENCVISSNVVTRVKVSSVQINIEYRRQSMKAAMIKHLQQIDSRLREMPIVK